MAKKQAKKAVAKHKSTNLLDKKHRPIHGMLLGGVVYFLHSIYAVLSVVGIALVLVSLLVYLMRIRKSH